MSSSFDRTRLALPALFLFVIPFGGACADAPPSDEWVSEGTLRVHQAPRSDEPARSAFALGDGRLLVDTDEGLQILQSNGDAELVGRPDEIGRLEGVVALSTSWLLLGSDKAVVLRESELYVSELQRALATDEHVRSVVTTIREEMDPDLWVLTNRSLYLFRENALSAVTLGDSPNMNDALLAAAPLESGEAVWLATSDGVFEVASVGDGLRAGVIPDLILPTAMATDGEGRLWFLNGRTLSTIDETRVLRARELPFDAAQLYSSSAHPDLWIVGSTDVWHHTGEVFRELDGFDFDAPLAVDRRGRLIAASSSGVRELAARNPLAVVGVDDGQRVTTPRRVMFETPSTPSEAEILLDGEPLELDAEFGAELPIDMLELGPHELVARAGFDDGTLDAEVSLSFLVTLGATWGEEIRPIFAAECAMCHGTSGSATTRLESSMDWEQNIENILFNVREERMPIDRPPLTEETIGLIEAWADAGFPQ